jgi:DNA-binding transcriptional ArsR family regulator
MANKSKTMDKTAADWLQCLAEPNRLAIIKELAKGSKNVTELAKLMNVEIVNVSHHLGVLRQGGLVSDEKHGRFVVYSLNGGTVKGTTLTMTHDGTGYELSVPLA